MKMENTPIQIPLSTLPPSAIVSKNLSTQTPEPTSFGDMFQGFLKDVNQLQNKADQSIEKMMAGEIKDVHQVMLAAGEAKVAFNLLLEIRNKVMDAYQEVMRMRA